MGSKAPSETLRKCTELWYTHIHSLICGEETECRGKDWQRLRKWARTRTETARRGAKELYRHSRGEERFEVTLRLKFGVKREWIWLQFRERWKSVEIWAWKDLGGVGGGKRETGWGGQVESGVGEGKSGLVTVRSGGTCGVWATRSEPFLLVVRWSGTSVRAGGQSEFTGWSPIKFKMKIYNKRTQIFIKLVWNKFHSIYFNKLQVSFNIFWFLTN